MKKIFLLLLILILGVSTSYAAQDKIFSEDYLTISKFKDIANIYDCSISESFAAFITSGKLVRTIGFNDKGQLGSAVAGNSDNFIEIFGLNNIIKVETGKDFAVALTQTGKV
ncbi:MAG: hypothetical protein WCX81_04755, partial [Monoglobales bacterium]